MSKGRAVWPWAVGGLGVLGLAAWMLRGGYAREEGAYGAHGADDGAGDDMAERDAAIEAARRRASLAKEAADAVVHGTPAEGPPPGELVRDETREGRVLAALGLSREAWDALDESVQRAKAVDLLVSRGHYERTDAGAAVGAWLRADLLSQLAPLFRDSAGISRRASGSIHPVVRVAEERAGR